jgi:hypothetical protein
MSDRDSVARKPMSAKGGTVAYTGTASTAVVAPDNTTAALVWLTTDGYFSISRDKALATTSDCPLPAYTPWVVACEPGDKLSAIRDAVSGNLKYCWLC